MPVYRKSHPCKRTVDLSGFRFRGDKTTPRGDASQIPLLENSGSGIFIYFPQPSLQIRQPASSRKPRCVRISSTVSGSDKAFSLLRPRKAFHSLTFSGLFANSSDSPRGNTCGSGVFLRFSVAVMASRKILWSRLDDRRIIQRSK